MIKRAAIGAMLLAACGCSQSSDPGNSPDAENATAESTQQQKTDGGEASTPAQTATVVLNVPGMD